RRGLLAQLLLPVPLDLHGRLRCWGSVLPPTRRCSRSRPQVALLGVRGSSLRSDRPPRTTAAATSNGGPDLALSYRGPGYPGVGGQGPKPRAADEPERLKRRWPNDARDGAPLTPKRMSTPLGFDDLTI